MNTPVRSVKNQYRGINAHLHSIWQAGGGWSSFHTNLIVDIMRALQADLSQTGYAAGLEPSLQIRRLEDQHPFSPLSEKPYRAVKIYDYSKGELNRGDSLLWIELLSPSNKPSGRDAKTYFNKRLKLLDSGLVFVEIDYLHETAPTLRGIPVYRARHGQKRDAEARAYRIIVFDPRPQMQQGMTQVYEFDVDTPLPIVNIPLNAGDQLVFDFAVPYRKTYEETLHGFQRVDYAQLPPNFERYDRDDQTRIVNRMLTVLQAASDGRDLEAAPLPQADLLPLDAALDQIKALVSASAS